MQNKQSTIPSTIAQDSHFETQSVLSLQCGRHSINNLLGRSRFSKQNMDEICDKLSSSCINPHKSILGGDYDVNVLELALIQENIIVEWHDNRKEITLNHNQIGFLINQKGTNILGKIFCCISSNHWFVIRKKGTENYEECDSKNLSPQFIEKYDILNKLKNYIEQEYTILKLYKKISN